MGPLPGEVWLADLGLAAKPEPARGSTGLWITPSTHSVTPISSVLGALELLSGASARVTREM
jgi:hypothetical protein